MPFCSGCGKPEAKPCGQCKIALYCGRECQKNDWESHRKHCSDVSAYQLGTGSRKDLVWKADDLLGRVVGALEPSHISWIKELFDRKIAFYDAPMPGIIGARYLRCVLVYTGMEPPKKIEDEYDENPRLFYYKKPRDEGGKKKKLLGSTQTNQRATLYFFF